MTGIPAGTTAQHPAATAAVTVTADPVRIFSGEYRWVEYRETDTVTLPPNPRYQWEYQIRAERSAEEYNGTPAIHYRVTRTGDYTQWVGGKPVDTPGGWITVTETYYDAGTLDFLRGTWAETIKGIPKTVEDLSGYNRGHRREDGIAGDLGITPFGELNIALTNKGTEPVTVPAGNFPDARKYTGLFRDGTPIAFWVAPGVPVPVRYQFPNKDIGGEDPFQSYELQGWG